MTKIFCANKTSIQKEIINFIIYEKAPLYLRNSSCFPIKLRTIYSRKFFLIGKSIDSFRIGKDKGSLRNLVLLKNISIESESLFKLFRKTESIELRELLQYL